MPCCAVLCGLVLSGVCAEGGSSGGSGKEDGGNKMPEFNVNANVMLATTFMGAVLVYQVGCIYKTGCMHVGSSGHRASTLAATCHSLPGILHNSIMMSTCQ